jgi:hypothetical protein
MALLEGDPKRIVQVGLDIVDFRTVFVNKPVHQDLGRFLESFSCGNDQWRKWADPANFSIIWANKMKKIPCVFGAIVEQKIDDVNKTAAGRKEKGLYLHDRSNYRKIMNYRVVIPIPMLLVGALLQ